jgi:hypothetical protein
MTAEDSANFDFKQFTVNGQQVLISGNTNKTQAFGMNTGVLFFEIKEFINLSDSSEII